MGAVEFKFTVKSSMSLRDVYDAVHAEALAEDGDDPYSGTIATTDGVRLHPTQRTPVSAEVANLLGAARLDVLAKDVCEAIPVARPEDIVERVVSVTITAAHPNSSAAVSAAITAAVHRHLGDDEQIAGWEPITWDTHRGHTVHTTKGAASIRYFVEDEDYKRVTSHDATVLDLDGYPTKAEARAAAIKLVESSAHPRELGVVGRRHIDGNEVLLTVASTSQDASATVNVRLHSTRPNVDQAGWLLYGMATY